MSSSIDFWKRRLSPIEVNAETDLREVLPNSKALLEALREYESTTSRRLPTLRLNDRLTPGTLERMQRAYDPHSEEHRTAGPALAQRFQAWLRDPRVNITPIEASFSIHGELDVSRLGQAWKAVISRHPILRQRPVLRADGSSGLSNASGSPLNLLHSPPTDEVNCPLDPLTDALAQLAVWKTDSNSWGLTLRASHLVADAASMNIILKELSEYYKNSNTKLAPVSTYHQWAERQWETLESAKSDKAMAWWADAVGDRLADGNQWLSGLLDQQSPTMHADGVISASESARIGRASARLRTTPFVLLLAAFAKTLRGASAASKMILSTSFAHRTKAEDYGIVGCLTSRTLIPLNFDAWPSDSATDVIRSTEGQLWEALENTLGPFSWVRKASWPSRDVPVDEEPGIPYITLNRSWKSELDLEGTAVQPIVSNPKFTTRTLEAWFEDSGSELSASLRGPTGVARLTRLKDESVKCLLDLLSAVG